MTIPIKLKNSGVKDKQPNPQTDLQYGEVALNYNNESPALYTRGDDDSLIQLTGDGSVQTPTNLSVGLRAADSMVIESSTGADVTVPSASDTQAGLLDATDKAKLDAYPVSPGGLQEVTDIGNVTTNAIETGAITAAGDVSVGDISFNTKTGSGVYLKNNQDSDYGEVQINNHDTVGANVLTVRSTTGSSTNPGVVYEIQNNGNVTTYGSITAAGNAAGITSAGELYFTSRGTRYKLVVAGGLVTPEPYTREMELREQAEALRKPRSTDSVSED